MGIEEDMQISNRKKRKRRKKSRNPLVNFDVVK
jgi:hypothetical protein